MCLKIDRFIDEYEFKLLFDIEDIEAGIAEFKKLIEIYKEIHPELRRELEEEYEDKYEKYASKYKMITDWIKKAKVEIKRRKVVKCTPEEQLRKENEEKEVRLRQEERKEKEEQVCREEEELLRQEERKEKEERLRREEE